MVAVDHTVVGIVTLDASANMYASIHLHLSVSTRRRRYHELHGTGC